MIQGSSLIPVRDRPEGSKTDKIPFSCAVESALRAISALSLSGGRSRLLWAAHPHWLQECHDDWGRLTPALSDQSATARINRGRQR